MNYEKRYKELVEAIKQLQETTPSDEGIQNWANDVLYGTKETDDERIRKALIRFFGTFPHERLENSGVSAKEAIAWVEKHKPVEHLELKVGHWYVCYRAYCCRADHLTVREGERFMCEKDGVVKGFVIKDAEKYFKECSAPAPMENEGKISPKWTGEDEQYLLICKNALYKYQVSDKWDADIIIKWLEDKLKQREQKTKWTDEDEVNWSGIIDEIEANKSEAPDYDFETYDRFLSWMDNIKQRLGGEE